MDCSASLFSQGQLPAAEPDQQVFTILNGNSSGIELELTFQPTSNADGCSIRSIQRRGEDAAVTKHATTEVSTQDLHPLIEELELTNFSGRLVVTLRTKEIVNVHDTAINTGNPSAQKSISAPALRSKGTRFWESSPPVKEDLAMQDAKVPGLGLPRRTLYAAATSSSLTGNLDESISEGRNPPSMVPEMENVIASETEIGEVDGLNGIEEVGPGSPLHLLCAAPRTNLTELRACLSQNPDSPFVRNDRGQTPLHILTDNLLLWNSHRAREHRVDAHVFALELVGINPAAAASVDSQGGWPCQSLLQHWADQQELDRDKDSKGTSLSNFVRRGMGTVMSLAISKKSSLSLSPSDAATRTSGRKLRNFAPSHLTLSLESVLHVLSLAITTITLADEIQDTESLILQQKICVNIATHVPHLLPKLLLVEPEVERHRILNLPLIRRLLLEPLTTGPWLVSMVRHNGLVSRRRAVDYLLLLSDCSIDHFYPGGNIIVEIDDSDEVTELGKAFRKSQSQVFSALGDMGGELILSLAVVEDKELSRATSGSALWYILHQGLLRPFVIGIVLIDFVLHITLMLSFRSDVMVSGDLGVLSAIPSTVVTGEKFHAQYSLEEMHRD